MIWINSGLTPATVTLAAIRQGDDRAFASVAKKWQPTVSAMAAGMTPNIFEQDDYAQEGTIALHRACLAFAADGKSNFTTYAARAIKNAMLDLLRTERSHRRLVEFVDPCDLPEYADNDADSLDDAATHFVRKWFQGLPLRDRQIIIALFSEGVTQAEAGRRLGITRARVNQIVQRLFADLRSRTAAELN